MLTVESFGDNSECTAKTLLHYITRLAEIQVFNHVVGLRQQVIRHREDTTGLLVMTVISRHRVHVTVGGTDRGVPASMQTYSEETTGSSG